MKKQLRIPFEGLNWDLFCKRGALSACFDRDELVLGMGDSLPEGDIRFFQHDFFNEQRWEYIPEIICFVKLDQLNLLEIGPQVAPSCGNEDALYLEDLAEAIASFDDEFKKVVLISRESYDGALVSRKKLLLSLLGSKLGYHYGMWNEEGGLLGTTPEVLFSKRGRSFKSMALASTRPVEKKDELLADPKELLEHRLVIEDIREKLADQEDLAFGETGIEVFGNLAHLKTEVSFDSGLDCAQLANRLSPTAALGGFPKNLAKDFIKASRYHKKHPARKFGGVFGIEQGERALALVAIRNIQWDSERYYIECGGGVVPGSTQENELAEVRRKRKLIKDIFFCEQTL